MRATTVFSGLLLVLAIPAGGCESTPDMDHALPAAGPQVRVEILDDWFVAVDGKRQPRDEYVYRSRLEGRRLRTEGKALPPVRLTIAEGAGPPSLVDDLITQLRLAGVQHIEIGQ